MFRCSSNSLFGGKYPCYYVSGTAYFVVVLVIYLIVMRNATFSVQFNTQPGENVYLVGNAPEMGEWDVAKARKMTWNCGKCHILNFFTPHY